MHSIYCILTEVKYSPTVNMFLTAKPEIRIHGYAECPSPQNLSCLIELASRRRRVGTGGRFPLHGQARQRLGRLLPSSTSLPCARPFPCLLIRDIGTPESRGAEAVFRSSLKVFVCLSRRRRPCMPPNLALSAAQRISTIAPIRSSAAPACSSPRPTTGTSSPGGTTSTRAHPRPSTDEIATRASELPSRLRADACARRLFIL